MLRQRSKNDIRSNSSTPLALPAMMEAAGKGLALVSLGVLSISVAYDVGYLFALGLYPSQVPTSVVDHARTAIVWLPGAVVILLTAMLLDLLQAAWGRFFQRVLAKFKKGLAPLSGTGPVGSSSSIESVESGWQADVSIFVFILLTAYFHAAISLVGLGLLFIWISRSNAIFRAAFPNASKGTVKWTRLFVAGLLLAATAGCGAAEITIKKRNISFTVVIKQDAQEKIHLANGVRAFSSVTILILPDRNTLIVPSGAIVSMHTKSYASDFVRAGGGPGEPPDDHASVPKKE